MTVPAFPPGCLSASSENERRDKLKLLTNEIREQLLRNGRLMRQFSEEGVAEPDFFPVVKLFTPDAACTWLLSEIDPDEPDIAFGLCDLGMGYPELGSVRISELESVRGKLGLPVERDGAPFFRSCLPRRQLRGCCSETAPRLCIPPELGRWPAFGRPVLARRSVSDDQFVTNTDTVLRFYGASHQTRP